MSNISVTGYHQRVLATNRTEQMCSFCINTRASLKLIDNVRFNLRAITRLNTSRCTRRPPIATVCNFEQRQQQVETHSRRHALTTLGISISLAGSVAPPCQAEQSLLDPECSAASAGNLTTVTDAVFLDFGLCPEGVRSDRRLGDKTILCENPESLGKVVIGLYGNAAPGTVQMFKKVIASGNLNGTCLSKVFPGQWLVAGQQGPRRSGLLEAPADLPSNPDMLSSSAFCLRHLRPGTVSLNLSQNEDEEYLRLRKDYRNLSFLITTGPAPASALDGENIVFGSVLEGLDVVGKIGRVPTFQPSGNLRAFNDLASFIGDERAGKTRAKWGKPLKAVVIVSSGIME